MISVAFRKHVKPRLAHLKAHLNSLLDQYHEDHPYGDRKVASKFRLLKKKVDQAFRKVEGELEDVFEEKEFLRDLLDELDPKEKD